MKKKKVSKLINEALLEEFDYVDKSNNIIIAKYITKHKGRALYYNPKSGVIVANDIDFRDTHKHVTDNCRLMRFGIAYLDAAKSVAICYMKENNCGYSLYDENGIIVK